MKPSKTKFNTIGDSLEALMDILVLEGYHLCGAFFHPSTVIGGFTLSTLHRQINSEKDLKRIFRPKTKLLYTKDGKKGDKLRKVNLISFDPDWTAVIKYGYEKACLTIIDHYAKHNKNKEEEENQ